MHIIALDLETTWLDSKKDSIIEIALVKFDAITFEIVEQFSTLINPEIEIPDLITNITNISNADILDAPYFDELIDKIKDFIWDLPILWHNVYFDRSFLIENDIAIDDNIALDTFLLANFLVNDSQSLSLETLSKKFKLDLTWAHRALNDTIATLKLFSLLIWKINKLSEEKQQLLFYILSKSEDTWFRYILDTYLKNIDIIDKTIFIKKIKKAFKYKKIKNLNIDQHNIDNNYRQFISNIDSLELRKNQTKMLDMVNDCLVKNNKIAIEAPTWVWKTFAYLLPSIYYSIKNNEQVFISTSTKALQDQIIYKDLEFLKNNLDLEFSFVKLKWKRNYLWVFSFFNFFEENDTFSKEMTSFLLKISYWIYNSKSWELDELDYFWKEFWYIRNINADNLLVFSSKNPYSNIEPILVSRKNAKKANIVVINNNLLFQDIKQENTILWKISNLVIDEAHNLEDVVTNSLRKSFCIDDLEKSLKIVDNIVKNWEWNIKNIWIRGDDLLFKVSTLFDILLVYLKEKTDNNSSYKTLLLDDKFFEDNIDNFLSIILSIKSDFLHYLDLISLVQEDIYLKLNREISIFENILEIIETFSSNKNNINFIRIISYDDRKKLSLEYTVLKPGDFLIKNLWKKIDSCILTSATLKIGDSFDYINWVLSLDWFNFESLWTDFSYDKQALLYIPNNLWNIKNNLSIIIDFLWELFLIVRWKTLVLFTAYYNIKQAYLTLNMDLKKNNINMYAQGIWWWKSKLLDFYKSNYTNSLLLWTDTFWEWIDIPWDTLKYLVIHKVPFMVPSDPIFIARSALYKNSFIEYSVPKAILKLKQWFWRLIRTKQDSWIIIFLDDRIYSTLWWNELYKAFPENINKKIGSSNSLLDVLKND